MNTGKKKVYIGILVAALAGLAVDRLFLDAGAAPEPAAARSESPAPEAPVAPLPTAAATTDKIADRLQALAEAGGVNLARVRDAFCPAESWTVEAKPAPKVAPRPVGPSPAELFRKAHKLTAVMAYGQMGKAVIGIRVLEVGQVLDRFVLQQIDQRSVTFTRGDHKVVLRLKD